MRKSLSIFAALAIACVAMAPAQAAYHNAKSRHHVRVARKSDSPQRVCDWVGPGGRAIYRCTTVQPQLQSSLDPKNEPAHRPTCDWVGPGGRAIYVCRGSGS